MKKVIVLSILFVGVIIVSLFLVNKKQDSNIIFVENCNLQVSPCVVQMPYGSEVKFDIDPRPVVMNQRIYTMVDAINHSLDSAQLDLKGIEMDMGYNRPILKDIENKHLFKQQIYMPACTSDFMHWQMTYIISYQQKKYSVVFKIKTEKE